MSAAMPLCLDGCSSIEGFSVHDYFLDNSYVVSDRQDDKCFALSIVDHLYSLHDRPFSLQRRSASVAVAAVPVVAAAALELLHY